jgi:hypothetical protein
MLLCGCAALAERPSKDGERLPSAEGGRAAVAADDGEPVPGSPSIASAEVLLTSEQANCLELSQAACAACHRRSQGFVLRPIGVPPPPPGTPTVADERCVQPGPASAADTGIPPVEQRPTPDTPIDPVIEQLLSDEQAMCIGLDQAVCAGCHRRQGSFLLKPRGLPPHPEVATALVEQCL